MRAPGRSAWCSPRRRARRSAPRAASTISAPRADRPVPEGRRAAGIGEQRRDRDDRHHRLGADDRHQHQRHQRAGAVAGDAADHRGEQRHRRRSAASCAAARCRRSRRTAMRSLFGAKRAGSLRQRSACCGAARQSAVGSRRMVNSMRSPGSTRQDFDLGHIGRLGKAAKHFARLLARGLARQREGVASEGVARRAWPASAFASGGQYRRDGG